MLFYGTGPASVDELSRRICSELGEAMWERARVGFAGRFLWF